MKTQFAIISLFLLVSRILAEELTLSAREIESSKVIQDKERTITIQRIKAPSAPPAESEKLGRVPVRVAPAQDTTNQKESLSFTISATVIDGKITMLEWESNSDPQQKIVSFSNVNWNLFGGFQTLEDKTKSYTAMIFARTMTRSDFDELQISFPDHLPSLEEGGARYTIVSEGEISPIALSFLETVHKFYDKEERKIKNVHAKREKKRKARERELRENPPKQEDVVIQFWKREPKKETQTK